MAMSIERYKRWKNSRGEDASLWKRADCSDADALIKEETIKNLNKFLKTFPIPTADFLRVCVSAHWGSVETDNFLTESGLYPDWV